MLVFSQTDLEFLESVVDWLAHDYSLTISVLLRSYESSGRGSKREGPQKSLFSGQAAFSDDD